MALTPSLNDRIKEDQSNESYNPPLDLASTLSSVLLKEEAPYNAKSDTPHLPMNESFDRKANERNRNKEEDQEKDREEKANYDKRIAKISSSISVLPPSNKPLSSVLLNEESQPSLISSSIRENSNNKVTTNVNPSSPVSEVLSLLASSSAPSSILPSTKAAAASAASVSKDCNSRLDRQASIQSLELEPPALSSVLSPESKIRCRQNHQHQ